ncbi:MAG: polysaccharide deacetylase family protein [Bacteroidales bacterium]
MIWIPPYLYRRLPGISSFLVGDRLRTRWLLSSKNRIHLTFDDGPHPEITEQVLDILGKYNAKATFFLLGKNVEAYPMLAQKIVEAGHGLGNHTYSHLDGWKSNTNKYVEDIRHCQLLLPKGKEEPSTFGPDIIHSSGSESDFSGHSGANLSEVKERKSIPYQPRLFRPPYGHFTYYQYRWLKRADYITVLWTHLSLDFRTELSPEKILKGLLKGSFRAGDVIVFHDSEKASPRMLYALPRFIETMMGKGYIFESLV